MTEKQRGWNDGLEIVLDAFNEVAWQKGQRHVRTQAAIQLERQLDRKCQANSGDYYRKNVLGVGTPFCKMLKGEGLPLSPFVIALPEGESHGRNDALDIVLHAFGSLAHRKGIAMNRSSHEIADEMEQLVAYEGPRHSQDYWNAMANIVRPFYNMLKDKPQRNPPFDT